MRVPDFFDTGMFALFYAAEFWFVFMVGPVNCWS